MRIVPPVAVALIAVVAFGTRAQPTAESLAAAAQTVETVADGYTFTEGPAVAPDGSVWFTDMPANAIHRFDPTTGRTTRVTDDSGGANGLAFLPGGRLWACEDRGRRRVAIFQRRGNDGTELTLDTVVPGGFNGPNDVAVRDDGRYAYFTDPLYGQRENPAEFEGVYAVNLRGPVMLSHPAQIPAELIITDLVRPNGIGLSPDQRTLYVADNAAKLIMAYPLDGAGQRDGDGVLFHDLNDLGGPDGMTIDAEGNVYQAIYGQGIVVIAPDGKRIGFMKTGPKTTNCALADDGATLYVTAEGALKRIRLAAEQE